MKTLKKNLVTGLALIAVCSLLLSGCTFGKAIGSGGSGSGFFRSGFQAYVSSLSATKEVMLKDSEGYRAFVKAQSETPLYIAEK